MSHQIAAKWTGTDGQQREVVTRKLRSDTDAAFIARHLADLSPELIEAPTAAQAAGVARSYDTVAAAVSATDWAALDGRFVLIAGPQGGLFTVDAAASGTADGSVVIDVNGGAQQLVRVLHAHAPVTLADPPRTFTPQIIKGRALAKPSGFAWTPPILPQFRAGRWTGNVSARSLRPTITGATYYVDAIAGDNGNDGSSGAPFKSIKTALQQTDVQRVLVAPAIYYFDDMWANPTLDGSVDNLVVDKWAIREGDVINTSADYPSELAWSTNATYSHVYEAASAEVSSAIDMGTTDSSGLWRPLREVSSLAECAELPGSWWWDSATIYVNGFRGQPDSAMLFNLIATAARISGDKSFYVDGIHFVGSVSDAFRWYNNDGTSNGVGVFRNCKFTHAGANGLATDGGGTVVVENCVAALNKKDGFNYHDQNGVHPGVVEINCRGFLNGTDGTGINNGSTIHDAGSIVRIGGEYHENEGPNIGDIGGSEVWCVGCWAHDSTKIAGDGSDFWCDATDMWLYECLSGGSATGVLNTTSGSAYLHNVEPESYSGTIAAYVQT